MKIDKRLTIVNQNGENEMTKEIRICKNWLEISKQNWGYMLCDSTRDLFIHARTLKFGQHDVANKRGWLMFYDASDTYIGSIWISADVDMKKIEQFLEETK